MREPREVMLVNGLAILERRAHHSVAGDHHLVASMMSPGMPMFSKTRTVCPVATSVFDSFGIFASLRTGTSGEDSLHQEGALDLTRGGRTRQRGRDLHAARMFETREPAFAVASQ